MGSAFTAVESPMESSVANPASFANTVLETDRDFKFYLNPITSVLAAQNGEEMWQNRNMQALDWLSYTGFFLKAVSFTGPALNLHLSLSEELPSNPIQPNNNQMPSIEGMLDWNYHSVSAQIRLAEQVSLGASGFIFNTTTPADTVAALYGSSYGILMRPSERFSAGLTYFDLPMTADTLMYSHHRISDETINVGVAYKPWPNMTVALDFRNVSGDTKPASRELHAGAELQIGPILCLRGGFFQNKETGSNVYSAGFGIVQLPSFGVQRRSFLFRHLVMDYTVRAIQNDQAFSYQHYATLLLKF